MSSSIKETISSNDKMGCSNGKHQGWATKSRVPVAKVKNEPALRHWKKLLVRVMRHDADDGMYRSRAAQGVQ